ncbi:MFS transporter [Altererythrobacter salegens]|uniref:MFS transporter n=1 Tax=Croceibacterium salegens TaxID=1737568 RepID=A0A6I4SUT3_9SPHN|nr:MFS transporter [Croceibacterium salegens]MXO58837.1 MFS transporter [Croceibacterium salegens]
MASAAAVVHQPSASEIRLVIAASSAGTIFEWYDFFIYGTLASFIGAAFVPSDNDLVRQLTVWAGFAVGFGFRPLGAVLFGYLGDKLGRKYTFLVTVTLMGIATAGVGLVPSVASIGLLAPVVVILLRIMQGLALGGEYGGAAIYVSEHSPPGRRGFYTGFIQASVVGGFVLSLIVVLACKLLMDDATWAAWGWRVPFVLSLALLAISLWMRFKLSESPVFKAMKAEGQMSSNPFKESFTYPGNGKRIVVALFGVAAGLTVIWYTAMFSGLNFLKGPMRIEETAAEIIVGIAALIGMSFFVYFGALSDRIGRKPPIVWGYALTLVLLFPCFWLIGWVMEPSLAISGENVRITPSGFQIMVIIFALLVLSALSGATYGSVAALLSEMFPPKIRYSSMSIPYHIGTGYFGGFLPLIATAIVAETGNPYSGLWYTWAVVLMALVFAWWGLRDGPPRDFADE